MANARRAILRTFPSPGSAAPVQWNSLGPVCLPRQVLLPEPPDRRCQALRVGDPRRPAERVAGLTVAEVLVPSEHVNRLSRQEGARLQSCRPAQEPVSVLKP